MSDSPLTQVHEAWMETYSGRKFYFLRPNPYDFDIVDIAHALAYQTRYAGHAITHYSVAEHSVLMAEWLEDRGYPTQICFTALMHDAAEAYIGDLVRPLKEVLPEFKAIENRIDKAVSQRYTTLWPFPPIVKELDTRILVDERDQVKIPSENDWGLGQVKGLGVKINFWKAELAKKKFLETFNRHCRLMARNVNG